MRTVLFFPFALAASLLFFVSPSFAEEEHKDCHEAIIHSFSVADYLWEEEKKKVLENITVSAVAKSKQVAALNRRYNCYISTVCWGLGKNPESSPSLPVECNFGTSEATEPMYTNAKEAFETLEIDYFMCNKDTENKTQEYTRIQCETFQQQKKRYGFEELGKSFSTNLSLEVQGVLAGKILDLTKRLIKLHEEVGRFITLLNKVVKDINCTLPETKT